MALAINIDTKFLNAITNIDNMHKQIPYSRQAALNDVAFAVRNQLKQTTLSKVYRPTPFISSAWRVHRATNRFNPIAEVLVEDQRKGRYWIEILRGGYGVKHRLTKLLQNKGFISLQHTLTPSKGVKKNVYDNVTYSTYSKIIKKIEAKRSSIYLLPRFKNVDKRQGVWERFPNKRTRPLFFASIPQRSKPVFYVSHVIRHQLELYPVLFREHYLRKLRKSILNKANIK